MSLKSNWGSYPSTNSAVVLADGSLESAVLAWMYVDRASQEGQGTHLTLLSALTDETSQDPAAKSINHLYETLQARYPSLTIQQRYTHLGLPRFLFSCLDFMHHLAPFLRLVEDACTYGNTFLIPLYADGPLLPGVPSPHEIIEAVNVWLESLSAQQLRIAAPFQEQSKQAIVQRGVQLGVDLENTFDCEEPIEQEPCYSCRRCVYRYSALAQVSPASFQQAQHFLV